MEKAETGAVNAEPRTCGNETRSTLRATQAGDKIRPARFGAGIETGAAVVGMKTASAPLGSRRQRQTPNLEISCGNPKRIGGR
jgi:hypothetical protein